MQIRYVHTSYVPYAHNDNKLLKNKSKISWNVQDTEKFQLNNVPLKK